MRYECGLQLQPDKTLQSLSCRSNRTMLICGAACIHSWKLTVVAKVACSVSQAVAYQNVAVCLKCCTVTEIYSTVLVESDVWACWIVPLMMTLTCLLHLQITRAQSAAAELLSLVHTGHFTGLEDLSFERTRLPSSQPMSPSHCAIPCVPILAPLL